MRFELGLEEPQPKRAQISALRLRRPIFSADSYHLPPYILLSNLQTGLCVRGRTLVGLRDFRVHQGTIQGIHPTQAVANSRYRGLAAGGPAYPKLRS